jgi:hypothetical protein
LYRFLGGWRGRSWVERRFRTWVGWACVWLFGLRRDTGRWKDGEGDAGIFSGIRWRELGQQTDRGFISRGRRLDLEAVVGRLFFGQS